MPEEHTLLKMAEELFGELSIAERELFLKAPQGKEVMCGWDRYPAPSKAEAWGPKHSVRAECIQWLCADAEAQSKVHRKGLRIIGAKIEKSIDLDCATIPFILAAWYCSIPQGILLQDAETRGIVLGGSHIGVLSADRITIKGSLHMGQGFHATGEARFPGADIGGVLACTGGRFDNSGGKAIHADGAVVKGDVFMDQGFHATGEVRFLGAEIDGDLACAGGRFDNSDGYTINAGRTVVKGTVFMHQGFHATGETSLLNAKINGVLVCSGGRFDNPNGRAINADGLRVHGPAYMDKDFHATGEVAFLGAEIGGNLDCSGGRFDNPGGRAINANGFRVHGPAFLRGGFHAQGTLDFSRAIIDGGFHYYDVNKPEQARLDFEHASLGVLWDEEASWPKQGNLLLHGLKYDEIHHSVPHDAATRKRWLALQPKDAFTPQPYEQMAAALRKAGNERDAREILIEKNRQLKHFDSCLKDWGCIIHWLFGLFLGYGYKPRNALWWILGFIMLGTSVFHVAGRDGMMAKAQAWNIRQDQTLQATMLGEPYPRFNALMYSIDTFIPFIDLDQEDYWIPANDHQRVAVFNICKASLEPQGLTLVDWRRIEFSSTFLYIYFWCHICLGWIFTGLLIIGITGMLQRRSE